MTRLATALVLLAGGITGAVTTPDTPTMTLPAVTAGKHRPSTTPRSSRSMQRLPWLLHVNPVRFSAGKARPHREGHHSVGSHDLRRGARQPHHNWDAVAQCESSGRWQLASGNGYFGGLQFTLSTWRSYGGRGWPQAASRSEQIDVAERVLASQGVGAWPVCGVHL